MKEENIDKIYRINRIKRIKSCKSCKSCLFSKQGTKGLARSLRKPSCPLYLLCGSQNFANVEKLSVDNKGWSLERRLRIQFRKYLNKGYLKNVELDPSFTQTPTPLLDNEICVVHVTAKNGVDYYLTNLRILSIVSETTTILKYQDLIEYEWIIDNSDVEEKARLKRLHYDRIFLKDRRGNQMLLSGLDQAVFPFLKFLAKVITDNKNEGT